MGPELTVIQFSFKLAYSFFLVPDTQWVEFYSKVVLSIFFALFDQILFSLKLIFIFPYFVECSEEFLFNLPKMTDADFFIIFL